MGRNSKPLTILCTDDWIFHSEAIKKFIAKGHTVVDEANTSQVDVVISPKCWRIDPKLKLGDDSTEEESLERQLEMMEKGIRAIKYPKEKKDAKTTKNSSN